LPAHFVRGSLEQFQPSAADDEFGAEFEKAAPHRGPKPRAATCDEDPLADEQIFFEHCFIPPRVFQRRHNPNPIVGPLQIRQEALIFELDPIVRTPGVSMKAILCSQFCQPDDLVLADVADPVAEPGQAVIAIKAAALNFFDILMIQGKYQIKPPFPFSPAAEVAGIIESVGAGVTGLKVGDRVVASCGHNGAREKIALPAVSIVKIPDNLDFDRAAGIIIIYGTALHALEDRASPKPGETLAVLGAAGGTGLAACELGRLMGLKVIACASSEEKLEFAKAHGAELTLNYAKEDLKEGLRRLTGGKGVDIIFDPVGGTYAEAALRAIAWEGRFLVIGFAAGDIPKMPLNLALLKGCDIRGVFWGNWARLNPENNRANLEKLVRWTAEGKLSSHVDRTFPLAQTADALKVLAGRKAMGKVVLHP
jgi:NADPH2:quinone reductase